MNKFNHKYLTIFVLAASAFLILWSLYGKIMISPNSYMLSDDGEAMRSYYVMSTYLNDDSTWLHHNNMNYPFGEHLSYCDGQPLTAIFFKGVTKVFPALKNYGVGYMNILSLYSLILGVILVFLVMNDLKIPSLYAAFIAISLMMLTPQITRIRWQPALAMTCYIPIFLYLLNKTFKYEGIKWQIILGLNSFLWYFIHPYLGLMLSVFLLILSVTKWMYLKKTFTFTNVLTIVFQTIVPAVFFLLFMKITDTHTLRVESPIGLVKFSSYFDSVFISLYSPFINFYKYLTGYSSAYLINHMEAWAYIGLSSTVFLISMICRFLYLKIKGEKFNIRTNNFVQLIFITSFVLLLISFALPFKLFPKSQHLLDLLPPLKQFRALGRFAWFFVYAVIVLMGYYFTMSIQVAKSRRRKFFFQFLFFLSFSTLIFEGYYIHKESASESNTVNRLIQKDTQAINLSDYQCIVPIPYFHIGSHRFSAKSNPSNKFITEALIFSYKKKLPLTSSFFSRNSISESIASFQFFSDDVFEKKIKSYFSEKPILVYYDKSKKVSNEEKRIIKLGTVIHETGQVKLLSLFPNDVFKNMSKSYLSSFNKYKASYVKSNNLYRNKNSWCKNLSYTNNLPTKRSLSNNLIINPILSKPFFDSKTECHNAPNGHYKISFWFNHNHNRTNNKLFMRVINNSNQNIIEEKELSFALQSFNVINDWMLCEFDIHLENTKNIQLYFKPNSEFSSNFIFIDKLMIRSAKSSIFEEIKPYKWLWNNRPLFDYENI